MKQEKKGDREYLDAIKAWQDIFIEKSVKGNKLQEVKTYRPSVEVVQEFCHQIYKRIDNNPDHNPMRDVLETLLFPIREKAAMSKPDDSKTTADFKWNKLVSMKMLQLIFERDVTLKWEHICEGIKKNDIQVFDVLIYVIFLWIHDGFSSFQPFLSVIGTIIRFITFSNISTLTGSIRNEISASLES